MALKFAVNNSLSAITSLPSSISGGALNLISTQTASASATIDFTSGIDSTYDSYVFKFINIHPSTSGDFSFQGDTGTNTNYNQTITSTCFETYHEENDSDAGLGYRPTGDQAQGTAFQRISSTIGTDNDNCCVGTLQIFNPSSNVFVKHFIANCNGGYIDRYTDNHYVAGYFNTTTPLTRFRFKFVSGNIDDGIIKMYGVS